MIIFTVVFTINFKNDNIKFNIYNLFLVKYMEVGISTASFFNRLYNEDTFEYLHSIGCNLTEVFFSTYSEYEEDFVNILAKRKGNINIHSVHALGTQFEPELYNISPRVRADAEKIYRKVCRAAQILGAKFLTFHGPYQMKNKTLNINYPSLGARTNELIEIANKYNVCLSYENVHYAYFNKPDFFIKLLEFSPNIYGTLDIKQAIQGDSNPYDMLEAIGDKLSTVHLCDIKENNETAAIGEGKFDFVKLINTLKKKASDIPVILELYSKDYQTLEKLEQNFKYIKSLC